MLALLATSVFAAAAIPAFDPMVLRALDAWHVPGAAVAIVKDGAVLRLRGYGLREAGKPAPVGENTSFQIASLTKGFTAALLAQALADGRVHWDDPVIAHLPSFAVADPQLARELTIRDLASHRTGLSEVSDALWYASTRSRAEVLDALRFLPAAQPLRSGYSYLNVTYLVLGELLARVRGQPWEALVKQALLDPAGMTATRLSRAACAAQPDRATPHSDDEGRPVPLPLDDGDAIAPAAAMCSTAADLARWMQVLLGAARPEVLPAAAREALFTPGNLIPVGDFARKVYPGLRTQSYGAGWVLQHHNGRFVAWNTGGLDGVTATILLVPDEKIGIAVLTNGPRTSLPEALAFQALDLLTAAPKRDWSADRLALSLAGRKRQAEAREAQDKHRVPGTSPSVPVEAWSGTWKQPLLGELRIETRDKALVATLGGWIGDVTHFHYDTWLITWRRRPLGTTLATLSLDAMGKPARLDLEDYGEFRRGGR